MARRRVAVESALLQADVLESPNLSLLQAFLLYLVRELLIPVIRPDREVDMHLEGPALPKCAGPCWSCRRNGTETLSPH